jgi:hypothetical protein
VLGNLGATLWRVRRFKKAISAFQDSGAIAQEIRKRSAVRPGDP